MNLLLFTLVFAFLYQISISFAYAVCPLCTVAVGAGLGVSRALGIDDIITGIWIGALILSSSLWMADFIEKKEWKVPFPTLLATLIFYLLVVPPLYWFNFIDPSSQFLGFNKIIFGIILGSFVFLMAIFLDKFLRHKNDGKVFIYYQKVILPIFLLSLTSFIFYLITT